MNRTLLLVCVFLQALMVYAQGVSAKEAECLNKIHKESDFILSRINMINKDYETQVKQSQYGNFKSGDYFTNGLFDNTIRKCHRKLVRNYKKYPFRYQRQIHKSHHVSQNKGCLADQLHLDAMGKIHYFELSWQEAIERAEKNAIYFKQVDDIN